MGLPELELTGQIVDGRFFIERRIGAGGMGTVWRAKHIQSLQYFALKTLRISDELPKSTIQRCLKEARAAAALRSRHVVRVIDVQPTYCHNGKALPYLVMELLKGTDFESLLAQRGSLRPAEVVWVMLQLGRGIQLAHDHGIVHRDLKPANLFLTQDDEGHAVVSVCDFGLAKVIGKKLGGESDAMSTQTETVVGTPRYMAPEQLRNVARTTAALDQWPIGLMAYRMLLGKDYFDGVQTAVELTLRIVHDELPAPSRRSPLFSKAFDDWFYRSCARDPAERFASVQAQADALREALGDPEPVAIDPMTVRGSLDPSQDNHHPTTAVGLPSSVSTVQRSAVPLYVALGISTAFGVAGTLLTSTLFQRQWQRRMASISLPSAHRDRTASERASAISSSPTAVAATTEAPALASSAARAWPVPSRPIGQIRSVSTSVAGANAATTTSLPPSALPSASPSSPSAMAGLAPGAPCNRSIECSSLLCIAERCR